MKQITFEELAEYTVPARGGIDKIYLHWTAGRYNQIFDDYHICITGDGTLFISGPLTEKKAHTWRRNSRAVGVAICAAYGATGPDDLGPYPPTPEQMEMLAKVAARLVYEIGEMNIFDIITHAEAADMDGYGLYGPDPDCRWDLYGQGDEIRARALEIMDEWRG